MVEGRDEEVATLLLRAISKKYGKRVSAGKLSRDLHIWSEGNFYVSAESIRKWCIGRTKPRYEAISVLESFFETRLVTDSLHGVKPSKAPPLNRRFDLK